MPAAGKFARLTAILAGLAVKLPLTTIGVVPAFSTPAAVPVPL